MFESAEDIAACAGESAALARFAEVAQTLRSREPRLCDWLAEQPLRAIEVQGVLPRLLAVVEYFQAHPRPMRYARELGITGVDWASPVLPDTFDRWENVIGGVKWSEEDSRRSSSVRQ